LGGSPPVEPFSGDGAEQLWEDRVPTLERASAQDDLGGGREATATCGTFMG